VLVHGDALGDPGVGEDDEAEPTGAAGVAVPHDNGFGDLPEATEVLAEAVLVRLPGDAADEELPGVGLHRVRPPLPSSSPCNPQKQAQFHTSQPLPNADKTPTYPQRSPQKRTRDIR